MKIDLNLLRVFDILMEVHSVSRAADRLGLTQSAVSHALSRLREQLDDPLFVRARGGLAPTARAREIAPKVREGLVALRDAVSHPGFDPASTTRTFTVSASSYFCITIMPIAIERARREAPLAQFRIVFSSDDLLEGLDEGAIDLAIGVFGRFPARYSKSALYRERLVWVARTGTTADDLASRPRLALSRRPQPHFQQEMLVRGGLEQRNAILIDETLPPGPSPLTIHDPLSAGALVATSDLVALLPRQLARQLILHNRVTMLEQSEQDEVEMSMLWHNRSTADPAHVWLRDVVSGAALQLDVGAEDASPVSPPS
ncbi:LysR family transcriptional regulator [Sphingomonas immobilis]|uniref:LysR family transcriptional regulator n=1 Tax=Sphingomonas immobilis TaxID=3063997 RepID=A0ABT8ZZ32_9SPHN|nr:LysR family transcriptional regulator [Sphingomonas sp. CA1-15]MDO7842834.1 LysR family transcriptional regulator [Sphingomonas sp. CA1-15]